MLWKRSHRLIRRHGIRFQSAFLNCTLTMYFLLGKAEARVGQEA